MITTYLCRNQAALHKLLSCIGMTTEEIDDILTTPHWNAMTISFRDIVFTIQRSNSKNIYVSLMYPNKGDNSPGDRKVNEIRLHLQSLVAMTDYPHRITDTKYWCGSLRALKYVLRAIGLDSNILEGWNWNYVKFKHAGVSYEISRERDGFDFLSSSPIQAEDILKSICEEMNIPLEEQ